MREFILAFPLLETKENVVSFLDKVNVKKDSGTIMIPGCSLLFEILVKEKVNGLAEIFNEHETLSPPDYENLKKHETLLFLKFVLTCKNELLELNTIVSQFLKAGALGVYADNSGIAFTASSFLEFDLENFPMDPWINYIATAADLFTLGLESFNMPDFCISLASGNEDFLRNALSLVVHVLFLENEIPASGDEIPSEDGTFVLRTELKAAFKKGSPEFNKKGVFRLIKK